MMSENKEEEPIYLADQKDDNELIFYTAAVIPDGDTNTMKKTNTPAPAPIRSSTKFAQGCMAVCLVGCCPILYVWTLVECMIGHRNSRCCCDVTCGPMIYCLMNGCKKCPPLQEKYEMICCCCIPCEIRPSDPFFCCGRVHVPNLDPNAHADAHTTDAHADTKEQPKAQRVKQVLRMKTLNRNGVKKKKNPTYDFVGMMDFIIPPDTTICKMNCQDDDDMDVEGGGGVAGEEEDVIIFL